MHARLAHMIASVFAVVPLTLLTLAVEAKTCSIKGGVVTSTDERFPKPCSVDFHGTCSDCRADWDNHHNQGSVSCLAGDGNWYNAQCPKEDAIQVKHPTQCHIADTTVFSDIVGHQCSVDFHSQCDDCQAAYDADHQQVTLKCVSKQGTWSSPCAGATAIVEVKSDAKECSIKGGVVTSTDERFPKPCSIDFHGTCSDCRADWDNHHSQGSLSCLAGDGNWYNAQCPKEDAIQAIVEVKSEYCHISGTHVIGDMPEIKYKCDIDFYGMCDDCQGIWDAKHQMGTVKCHQNGKWYSSPCRPGTLETDAKECSIKGGVVTSTDERFPKPCSVDFHGTCSDCRADWDNHHNQGSVSCLAGDGNWYNAQCPKDDMIQEKHPTQCHIVGTKVFSDIAGHQCSVDFHSQCDDCQAAYDADHRQVTLKCVSGQGTWSSPCAGAAQIIV